MNNPIRQLFLELFRSYPWHFGGLFILILGQSLVNMLSVIAIAPITDYLMDKSGDEVSRITKYLEQSLEIFGISTDLMTVFIFFGGITIVGACTSIATRFAILRIKYDVLCHLLTDTMSRIFRARYLFFTESSMGTLLNSFQREVEKVGDTFGHIARLFANLLQATLFLLVPVIIDWKLTVVFIGTVAVLGLPLWFAKVLSLRLGHSSTETANEATSILNEVLSAARLVLSFGRREYAVNEFDQKIKAHAQVSVRFQTLLGGVQDFFVPVGTVSALAAIYVAYLDGSRLSDMAVILFAFIKLIPAVGIILKGKATIEGFVPAYKQLEGIRKLARDNEETIGSVELGPMQKGITFKEVGFQFPGRTDTLVDINLDIPQGKMIALVGESGSGKTTTVDLMLGLYSPLKGKLYIDNTNQAIVDMEHFRTRVGYVPQEPQLFNRSIKENLLWADSDASDERLRGMLELVQLTDFIDGLPDGIDTILGDRGARLSGGQRQRLALARALIREPELLVLDEATSALDADSEEAIQAAIDSLVGKMTIVVIAHRLFTVRRADYIYVLRNGRVVEHGSYAGLLDAGGLFAKMVRKQTL